MEIQELLDRQLSSKEAVVRAQESIERLEGDFEKEKRRQEILTRLEERRARVAAIANEQRELAEAERVHAEQGQRIDALSKLRDKAKVARDEAARKTEQAKEELARLESEDQARERQLKQSTLETRLAGLRDGKASPAEFLPSIASCKVEAVGG